MAAIYQSLLLAFWISTACCMSEDQSIINGVGLVPVAAWPHIGLVPDFDPHRAVPAAADSDPTVQEVYLPSPCRPDDNFLHPIYEITNLSLAFYYESGYLGIHNWDMSFTARDTQNNYTMICTLWATDGAGISDWGGCGVEGADIDTFTTRFVLKNVDVSKWHDVFVGRATISQIWLCSQSDDTYPDTYSAEGVAIIETGCMKATNPTSGQRDPCTDIKTEFPLVVDPKWLTPENTPRLEPHPVSDPEPTPPPIRPGRTADCTAKAFSKPAVVIDDFHYVPPPTIEDINTETVNFTVASTVTGARAYCASTVEQDEGWEKWYIKTQCLNEVRDDPYQSETDFYRVEFHYTERLMTVEQRFVCGDPEGLHETSFDIKATGRFPFFCNDEGSGTVCKSSRTEIVAEIRQPVGGLTPAPVPTPPNADFPGCTANSLYYVYFEADKLLSYHVWYKLHKADDYSKVELEEQSLSLDFRNEANDYTASCVITDSDTELQNRDGWVPCFATNTLHSYPRYALETWVHFDLNTRDFKFNQTWYCNDTDEAIPMQFVATGEAQLTPYQCGWTNTTQDGNFCWPYDTCTPEWDIQWCNLTINDYTRPVRIQGNVISTTELPPDAFTNPEPDPDQYSCTETSLTRPVELTLRNFSIATNYLKSDQYPNWTYSFVDFVFENSALAPRAGGAWIDVSFGSEELTPYDPLDDPTIAYGGYKRSFINDMGWSARVDIGQAYMEFNHSWYCEDKNPQNPILFTATWNGELPLSCEYNRPVEYTNPTDIVCVLPNNATTLTLRPSVTSQVQRAPIPDPTCEPDEVCPYARDANSDSGGVIVPR
ncbi:hypothetical protein F4808DRAFT_400840 [Astrocystis sublimbata]|nr:hypothetical protein F4808DRAFT_400840 [Astrocystis sublimbata]